MAEGPYKELALRIAGEIVLSPHPWKEMRKWREQFNISSKDLARELGVSVSVISDYESGRRKKPGTGIIRRYVQGLISIDLRRGGRNVARLAKLLIGYGKLSEALIDIREFEDPITVMEFCRLIDAELVVPAGSEMKLLYGYTVVDSVKLAVEVPSYEYVRLYGSTTQRAAVFTNVLHGRSPMVAIKAMQAGMGGLHPTLVVLHGPRQPDRLGVLIAERESIPLAVSRVETVGELVARLKKIG